MGGREWALLLLLAALWGSSFLFAKIAVAEVPPLTLVLSRVGIAALALQSPSWRPVSACRATAASGSPSSPWVRSTT